MQISNGIMLLKFQKIENSCLLTVPSSLANLTLDSKVATLYLYKLFGYFYKILGCVNC